ncbi:MAG TPA: hypothetical protein VEA38_16815 [Terriglobales bacterium]|nr:hypothetical protein [Terriglobales bacterium]
MSKDIVLSFTARSLEAAKKTAQEIARKVKEAAKAIDDVQVRKKFLAAQRQIAGERKEELKEFAEERAAFLAGSRARTAARVAAQGDPHAALRQGREAFGSARGLVTNLAAGNLAGVLGAMGSIGSKVAGLLPVLGPVAAIAGTVIGIILPELERREAIRKAADAAQLESLVRDLIEKADIPGRLRRDPAFRRQFEGEGAERFLATDRARVLGGWHPRSARALDGF